MWNEPSKERLDKIPRIYETEKVPAKDKIVHLHLFIGGCDWYVVEYDGEDLFFGFAVLNCDYQMAEWGYSSFSELKSIRSGFVEIDCELPEYWQPKPASEIETICKCLQRGW